MSRRPGSAARGKRLAARTVATLSLILALASAGCGWLGNSDPSRPNIVFLLVDTLRADHLQSYGYERQTSPFLDRLSRESVIFERAFSQAGCTFPSINSMLTSRYPQQFVDRDRKPMGFVEGSDWPLPAILRLHGYTTTAVSTSRIVRKNPSKYNHYGGFDVGFDSFDESCTLRPADCVNEVAFAWLDGWSEPAASPHTGPFFLYLHYLDPHAPYQPPRTFERRYADRAMPNRAIRSGRINPIKDTLYGVSERPIQPPEVDFLKDLYDEEIRYLDLRLEELMLELERRGLYDEALIVLASDHGEELLDHGHMAHCRDLAFDTVIRTPLLIKLPGSQSAGRVPQVVQNLDVVPTLLDYLRIPGAAYDFEGVSLRSLIDGDRGSEIRGKGWEKDNGTGQYALAAQGATRTITDGRHQLLLDLTTGDTQLFDLETPPSERIDLGGLRPGVHQELLFELRRWIAAADGADADAAIEAARELNDQLKAVGYL